MIKIRLGDKVKDKISGFTGIAIGITTWLAGCRRITIQSQELHDGKPIDPITLDEPQLEKVSQKKKIVKKTTADKGGPIATPVRSLNVVR